ncbi:MAG: bifunctional tetrahydrofolate synthase/dihydrofolate synthase [Pseudomonadota bacterium]
MTLSQWLDTIQALHPSEIDLGLQRVRAVATRLGLTRPAPLVITVAGTNGKGSTVAMLEAIFSAAGYRVGTYTSPHLLVYNERVRILGRVATDAELCDSFALIEARRGDISLTYFEFSTLAGLLLMEQAGLDVAVLEVGLGGRLDAVNIIDADLSIVTSIGLDHQDWLGDNREDIGREKAGIFRAGVPAVSGDIDTPQSIVQEAERLGLPLSLQGKDFGFTARAMDWDWWGEDRQGKSLALPGLPRPALDLVNAATVLQAIALQPLPVTREAIAAGLQTVVLAGRFQALRDPRTGVAVRVDVAHNPHAAVLLSEKLAALRSRGELRGQVRVVLAMMSDKDQVGFYGVLESAVDIWYIAAFAQPRCQDAQTLHDRLGGAGATVSGPYDSVVAAYHAACEQAGQDDLVLVTGSFGTVADAVQYIASSEANS